MSADRTYERASAEDIYFGQVVANWARWAIIGAALLLVLWTSTDTFRLMLGVLPIVGLMVVNFYLHGRYLADKPANGTLIAIASAIDIALITGLIVLWTSSSSLGAGLFVLYFPALVAFAFIMRPRISIAFTACVLGIYAFAAVMSDPGILASMAMIETLIARLITLAAVGILAAYFWRVQRNRRFSGQSEAA